MTHQPTLRPPGKGRTVAIVGDVYRVLATGADTGGKYALWEAIVAPGGGPPPHVHNREEEGFYVLEGEVAFTVNGARVVLSAGMFANMPIGTPHTFKNESNRPARMLLSVAPAGLEEMFFEVGVPLAEGATTALPPTHAEIERLLAAAPKYGLEIMSASGNPSAPRLTPAPVSVPDRATFETLYTGKAPWDTGRPQPAFVEVADQITGAVLDAGCGTGENALYFARRGRTVTGIDFLDEPIRRARQKAAERGVSATFLVQDALTLADWAERFDAVIDSGLFHVFGDADRQRYVEGLATVLRPAGRLFLLCFSDAEPGTQGPRRVAEEELRAVFGRGWTVESVRPTRFEVRPDLEGMQFSAGGPMAWFVVVRRE